MLNKVIINRGLFLCEYRGVTPASATKISFTSVTHNSYHSYHSSEKVSQKKKILDNNQQLNKDPTIHTILRS
jgi:hypothetical protein